MPDREKVIKGLEYCMGGCQVSCFKCPYRDPGEVPPDCLDNCTILQDAVDLLKESASGWTSVKDRMPENETIVVALVQYEVGWYHMLAWHDKRGWHSSAEEFQESDGDYVTHWMPLPEPPNGGQTK